MIPIPNHLKAVIDQRNVTITPNGDGLVAPLQCGCVGKVFKILYPGETDVFNGKRCPVIMLINEERTFFVIKAACVKCGTEHLLLDIDKHGFEACMCYEPEPPLSSQPKLIPWTCIQCNHQDHEAVVRLYFEGTADYLEEAKEYGLNPDLWPEAFSSFGLTTQCTHCEAKTEYLIDYEAM
jgi:hypothetical protein